MRSYSFYYRDSLDLKILFPQAYRFSVLYPDKDDNLIIEDGIMRLKRPEQFDPSRIHNTVRVYKHKYDYFKIEVNIRSWIEGEYQLKEITRISAIKRNGFFKLARRLVNKIYPLPFNTHLLTQDGVSYYSSKNHLVRFSNGKKEIIGKMPRLLHPRFYDFLVFDNEAFLRTAGRIYMSSDSMTHWKLIYDGKRAIKDSMIWIEEERSLLFMEYTPGLELSRHHLYKYYVETGETKTCMTFYTPDEHERDGLEPYCRHIHVLMCDPYTKDIYVGTGDADDENAIYRSSDNGNTFAKIGGGSQAWRTLSFLFTKENVFWNTDSPDPQYLSSLNRSKLSTTNNSNDLVVRWPLYNSASWNSYYDVDNKMFFMASNCEGTIYDRYYRLYGIIIDEGKPTVYELFKEKAEERCFNQFDQLFVLGKDNHGVFWVYDLRNNFYRQFVLKSNTQD